MPRRTYICLLTDLDPDYNIDDPPSPEPTSPILVRLTMFHKRTTLILRTPDSNDSNPGTIRVEFEKGPMCFSSELGLFRSNQESALLNFLTPKFDSLFIPSQRLVVLLSRAVNDYYDILSFQRRKELPVTVVVHTDTIPVISEQQTEERAARESRKEFERSNYGMVPATAESLDLVKQISVKVEEKSSCAICMEDLGGFATAMPCKHMFYDEFIITWLQVSHYCPVCRFELPTAHVKT